MAKTLEIEDGINIDLDENGKLIAIEIIGEQERYPLRDIFHISTEESYS